MVSVLRVAGIGKRAAHGAPLENNSWIAIQKSAKIAFVVERCS
jgi:hypothetical protein